MGQNEKEKGSKAKRKLNLDGDEGKEGRQPNKARRNEMVNTAIEITEYSTRQRVNKQSENPKGKKLKPQNKKNEIRMDCDEQSGNNNAIPSKSKGNTPKSKGKTIRKSSEKFSQASKRISTKPMTPKGVNPEKIYRNDNVVNSDSDLDNNSLDEMSQDENDNLPYEGDGIEIDVDLHASDDDFPEVSIKPMTAEE